MSISSVNLTEPWIAIYSIHPDCLLESQLKVLMDSLPSTLIGFVLYEETISSHNLKFSTSSSSRPCIYVNKEYALDLSYPYPNEIYYAVFTNDITNQDSLWKVTFGMILMILCLAFVFSLCMNYYIYMHHGYHDELPFTHHGNPIFTSNSHVLNLSNAEGNNGHLPIGFNNFLRNENIQRNENIRIGAPRIGARKVLNPSCLDQYPTSIYSIKTAAEKKQSMKQGFKDLRKKVVKMNSIASIKTNNENLEPCAICLEEYQEGDSIRELPCHHLYHTLCIDKWLLKRNGTCPLCKIIL